MRCLLTTAILITACTGPHPPNVQVQAHARDRLMREEIQSSAKKDADLYQVIRTLRPQFLEGPRGTRSAGGATSTAPLAVFVDGTRQSGVDALRSIDPAIVEEVRWLEPTSAENEYGPSASGGALLIKLIRAH
jgi:hypothetical protein